MNVEFNAYHQWLGIPAEIRSPNHYELLGLRHGESSAELIQSAAAQRAHCLQPLLPGEYGLLARRILAEVVAARDCLLDQRAKANYDRQLVQQAASPAGEQPLPPLPAGPSLPGEVPEPPKQVAAVASGAEQPPAQPPTGGAPASPDKSPSARSTEPRQPVRSGPRKKPKARSVTTTSNSDSPVLQPLDDESGSPRVPMVGKMDLASVLEELARAMQQCQQLYLSCVPPSEDLPETVSPHFAQNLDRLHRGLLAKTYATVAEADGRWTHEELRCAAALMQHLGVTFAPDALELTARKLVRQARSLDWEQLFQPFHEIPELSFRAAELQAVIARVANLIAKADGFVAPKETKALQEIQEKFRIGRRRAAAGAPPPLAAESPEAVQAVWESAHEQRRSERPKVDRAQLREQCLQQLEKLVGLGQLKHEICELADCVQFQSQRRRAKLPSEMPDLQFAFVGPSGTGKTLLARILTELLFASGGLRHGQLIEVNGFDLVSCEPREASKKMKAILTQAMGGTLVIEDAGALLLADNPSAVKALSVLRKNLTAHSGRVAVVLASVRADRLLPLLDQHADLPRLFHQQWHFTDYSTSELGRIFQSCCDRSQYRVTRLAQIKVLLAFHWCLRQDRIRFGNGHGAQRVYERAVRRLARRIAGISPLTKELLTTFHDSDIVVEGVPAEALANLDDPQRVFAVTCPGCASVHLVGKDLLGIRVECKSCHHRFVSAWGEPVE